MATLTEKPRRVGGPCVHGLRRAWSPDAAVAHGPRSATVAIGQGHDVRRMAGHLGHANPAMTLRASAHAFAAADQAVAADLGQILKKPES